MWINVSIYHRFVFQYNSCYQACVVISFYFFVHFNIFCDTKHVIYLLKFNHKTWLPLDSTPWIDLITFCSLSIKKKQLEREHQWSDRLCSLHFLASEQSIHLLKKNVKNRERSAMLEKTTKRITKIKKNVLM